MARRRVHEDFTIQQIAAMVSKGKTYGQVARRLGLTRNQVAGLCHRNGIVSPTTPNAVKGHRVIDYDDAKAMKFAGVLQKDIAKKYGVSQPAISYAIRK